jgi:hypothetical protein
LDWIWQGLVKQADSPADWIRFTPVKPGDKKLVVPLGKTREQPVIGLNIPFTRYECETLAQSYGVSADKRLQGRKATVLTNIFTSCIS